MNVKDMFATPWADSQAVQAEELAKRLQDRQQDLENANIVAARMETQFKLCYAKALLEAKTSGEKITESVADAKAMIACEQEYTEYKMTAAVASSSASAVRTLQSECDLYRTTASARKLEVELSKVG